MTLKVGDVVRYDRIWDKDLEAPLWAIIDRMQNSVVWAVPIHGGFEGMHHDEWTTSNVDRTYIASSVRRYTPDPSEWPEEVCVYMAKRALKVE